LISKRSIRPITIFLTASNSVILRLWLSNLGWQTNVMTQAQKAWVAAWM